ncbi:VIT1/CCC1 transporter family protein [Spirillospora albida]|uniref:VIT1/CCC1 transporter family protein n=1 Tax=Spirillospora albida TaxID=58123 RepID=UPI0004BF02A6|nr:VIT1/CCC1 transporter family protein [Spirillospora albida]
MSSDGGAHDGTERHHQHRDVTGGWLRPAVFGAMDGLVSNFALIAGVAGGQADPDVVLLAGLAGLASGAFSMAAGEYVSVASQSELAEAEIEVERVELARHPDAERRELAQAFEARGVDPDTAAEVARQLHRDPAEALEVHALAELGVTPGDLPSPVLAALSSFLSFAVGALLPVLPYLAGASTLWPAAVLAALGLFGAGALVARITARSWWSGGTRQLLLGGAAAAITYGVGALIGTTAL